MKKIILTLLTAFFSWWIFSAVFFLALMKNQEVLTCFSRVIEYPPAPMSRSCNIIGYFLLFGPLIPSSLVSYFVYKKLSNKKKPVQKR